MSTSTEILRAELSFRLRTHALEEWSRFTNLWNAFNSIYSGETGRVERTRVMACVRKYFSEHAALRTLRRVTGAIDKILDVPPGDMRRSQGRVDFREASRRCAAIYRDKSETDIGRLAAVGGVLYQVRCNLIHGSKDPRSLRDKMLVRESFSVLRVLVPALESQLKLQQAGQVGG